MFGPVSGGHFNPVVSFVDAAFGGLGGDAAAYLPAQVAGCISGAVVANLMFSRAAVSISTKHRASSAHFFSEVVATVGLLLVIFRARPHRPGPAGRQRGGRLYRRRLLLYELDQLRQPGDHRRADVLKLLRRGSRPSSAPSFIGAQAVGGLVAIAAIKALYPRITEAEAADEVVPDRSLDASRQEPPDAPTDVASMP